jgi:hypothetical protein
MLCSGLLLVKTYIDGQLALLEGGRVASLKLRSDTQIAGQVFVELGATIGHVDIGPGTSIGSMGGAGSIGGLTLDSNTRVNGQVQLRFDPSLARGESTACGGLFVRQKAAIEGDLLVESGSHLGSVALEAGAIIGGALQLAAGVTVRGSSSFASRVGRSITMAAVTFLGPVSFSRCYIDGVDGLILDGARLPHVTLADINAKRVSLRGAELGRMVLRMTSGEVDLTDATLTGRVTITSLKPGAGRPTIVSLAGVDASQLVLEDVDLRECRFRGAHQLDGITIGTSARFAMQKASKRLGLSKQILIEDPLFRGSAPDADSPVARSGPQDAAWVAEIYRQLRRAREASHDYSRASDFYYREMRLRELSMTQPFVDAGPWQLNRRFVRRLLQIYRLFSNYGLSVGRPLVALIVALALASSVFAWVGLRTKVCTSTETLTRAQQHGAKVVQCVSAARVPRIEAGVDAALDSSVSLVHSVSGEEPLSLVGTMLSVVLRLLSPVLLAMSGLAIRNHVRR